MVSYSLISLSGTSEKSKACRQVKRDSIANLVETRLIIFIVVLLNVNWTCRQTKSKHSTHKRMSNQFRIQAISAHYTWIHFGATLRFIFRCCMSSPQMYHLSVMTQLLMQRKGANWTLWMRRGIRGCNPTGTLLEDRASAGKSSLKSCSLRSIISLLWIISSLKSSSICWTATTRCSKRMPNSNNKHLSFKKLLQTENTVQILTEALHRPISTSSMGWLHCQDSHDLFLLSFTSLLSVPKYLYQGN